MQWHRERAPEVPRVPAGLLASPGLAAGGCRAGVSTATTSLFPLHTRFFPVALAVTSTHLFPRLHPLSELQVQQNWCVNHLAQCSDVQPLAKLSSSSSYLSMYLRQLSKQSAGDCPATHLLPNFPEKGFWHLVPSGSRGETKQNSSWYLNSTAWRLLLALQDNWVNQQVLLCAGWLWSLVLASGGGLNRPYSPAEITTDYKHKTCLVNTGEDAEAIPPPLNSGTRVKLKY